MSKPGTNWQSPDMTQRLAKRYAAERRFKRLGALAIFVSLAFVAFLLVSMLAKGLGGRGKIDVQRFKGLGEMDAKDLKDTTINPLTRQLIRVTIVEEDPGETGDFVERLMGKKPELRFQYIQENARFVEELDV